MKGPSPKPSALRQRRNRTSTAATLADDGTMRRVPPLTKGREWRQETRAWWRDVWRSPMAAEYLPADRHGLLLLADLIDRYWREPSTTLAGEIRQQEARFGLSPIDRRRLQWDVRPADGGAARAEQAEQAPPVPRPDPRGLLSAV